MTTYLYVDGESHFIRSNEACKQIHGVDLSDAGKVPDICGNGPHDVEARACFYWDERLLRWGRIPSWPARLTYFTAMVGQADLQNLRVRMRRLALEPQVITETKQNADRRAGSLSAGIHLKPKGVDIGLSVRILEDAYRDNFDLCLLFTSDVDYIPVIDAIRRLGKDVHVFGYSAGVATDSPLLYVPETFTDLTDFIRDAFKPPH